MTKQYVTLVSSHQRTPEHMNVDSSMFAVLHRL